MNISIQFLIVRLGKTFLFVFPSLSIFPKYLCTKWYYLVWNNCFFLKSFNRSYISKGCKLDGISVWEGLYSCYMTVDSAVATSLNRFCACKLSLYNKTNITHRRVVEQDHYRVQHISWVMQKTFCDAASCKNHRYVAAPRQHTHSIGPACSVLPWLGLPSPHPLSPEAEYMNV